MATLINDRNELLSTAAIRINNASVSISSTASMFTIPAGATSTTPATVTLTANTYGYNNPAYQWAYSFDNVVFTVASGTTKSITITGDAAYLAAVGSATMLYFRVTASEAGVNTSSYVLSFPHLRESTGAPSVFIDLLSEGDVVFAPEIGNNHDPIPNNDIRVYQGGTEVVATSYGPASTTIDGLIATVNPTNGQVTWNQNAWTGDTASFTFTATYNTIVYSTVYTVSKSRKGSSAVFIDLISSTDVVSAPATGNNHDPIPNNDIRVYQGGTEVVATSYGPASTTVDGLIATVNPTNGQVTWNQNAWTGNTASFTFTATYNSIVYTALYTVSKSRAGSTGTGVAGDTAVFAYNIVVSASMPASPTITAGLVPTAGEPPAGASNAVWYTNPRTTVAQNEWQFQVSGTRTSGGVYTWQSPSYLSNFKVGKLDALSIYTGNLDVSTTGHIKGGQTDYNVGKGFFLGYSGNNYKFSIGNPTRNITSMTIGASSVFTLAGHGYNTNDKIYFSNVGSLTNISINTIYYVTVTSTSTFWISLTLGGPMYVLTGTAATPPTIGSTALLWDGSVLSLKGADFTVGSAQRSTTTMTGAGAIIKADGQFSMGNTTGNITYDGNALYLNGTVVSKNNIYTGLGLANKIGNSGPSRYSIGPFRLGSNYLPSTNTNIGTMPEDPGNSAIKYAPDGIGNSILKMEVFAQVNDAFSGDICPCDPSTATTVKSTGFPVIPGRTYEFSAYVGTVNGGTATSRLAFYDSAGGLLSQTPSASSFSGLNTSGKLSDWNRSSLILTAPANATICIPSVRYERPVPVVVGTYYLVTSMWYFGECLSTLTLANISDWVDGSHSNSATDSATIRANAATTMFLQEFAGVQRIGQTDGGVPSYDYVSTTLISIPVNNPVLSGVLLTWSAFLANVQGTAPTGYPVSAIDLQYFRKQGAVVTLIGTVVRVYVRQDCVYYNGGSGPQSPSAIGDLALHNASVPYVDSPPPGDYYYGIRVTQVTDIWAYPTSPSVDVDRLRIQPTYFKR